MFNFEKINNKKILKSDSLNNAEHFFTTRETVVTTNVLTELKDICAENFKDISQYLKIEPQNIISPVQTHSANIAIAKVGKNFPDTDALIIDSNEIAILLNFADCTPVILYDEKNNIGAIAHAGWRGTAASIVPKTIDFMAKNYSTSPTDITAIIGPAISMKNYQVNKPVFEAVKSTLKEDYNDYFAFDIKTNKYNIDLKTVNFHQLKELGVQRIDKCNYCTYDSVDVFFSYRKEAGNTARHSAILRLT